MGNLAIKNFLKLRVLGDAVHALMEALGMEVDPDINMQKRMMDLCHYIGLTLE